MTVKELINKLQYLPDNAIVTYRHNQYGRIDVTTMDYQDEVLLSGQHIAIVTLEGKVRDKKNAVRKLSKQSNGNNNQSGR